MASLPFPSFINQVPVDDQRCALSAVGTCRISPKDDDALFRAICDKNIQQATVDTETPETKDENKKLKKKYMKEGVAMAFKYLQETLQLDVSVVDVQVCLSSKDVIDSQGCLAACLLDAGCAAIVMNGTELEAIDVAKLPRERIVAQLNNNDATAATIAAVLPLASTISIPLTTEKNNNDSDSTPQEFVSQMLQYLPEKNDKIIIELSSDMEDLTSVVATISKLCKDGKGQMALIDPTPNQLGMSYAACMKTDREDGLYTTVVCTRSNEALGLVYSSKESIVAALECGRGVYYSRSRNGLWRKGDTSGHYQTLHRLDVDCDGDALRFTVTQRGDDTAAFCHLNTLTCWGEPKGIRHLEGTLQERLKSAPEGSYTKRLFDDPELLRDKLVEEAQELSEASEPNHVAEELADVLYFAMVRAAKAGVTMDDAIAELDRRARKVTRRKGDSKAFRIAAGNAILNKEQEEKK